jgi:hypothetical protein
VAEFVPGVARAGRRDAIRVAGGLAALAGLLGRLHTMPGKATVGRAVQFPGQSGHVPLAGRDGVSGLSVVPGASAGRPMKGDARERQ